ncbi:hypothetical protein [Streptomyces sp. NPDC000410]|uniref:hypothetical protein n=1 Tax=Streptomyces sp. NPDC000410 TaxID=3154254 RepID=UPI003326E585
MAQAAAGAAPPADSDRLSFTTALRAARRTVTCTPGTFPDLLERAWRHFDTEVRERLLPPRRPRGRPRVVKRKTSNYKARTSRHRDWPQPTRPPHEAIVIQPP